MGPTGSCLQFSIGQLDRRLKSRLKIEQYPAFADMKLESLEQEIVIDRIEKSFDIKVQDPVSLSATPPTQLHGLVSRTTGSIPKRIRIKDWLQFRFDDLLVHHWSDARQLHHAEQPTIEMPKRRPESSPFGLGNLH